MNPERDGGGSTSPSRILVVRPDRLGDVILSTPVLTALKTHFPSGHLTFMVRDHVVPILKGLPCIDQILVYDPEKPFWDLVQELKAGQFDAVIVLQSQFRIAAALFFAGIRKRIGPLSKLHSYFFYNKRVRQNRSRVEMHEADYNLQLLEKLGIGAQERTWPTEIFIAESEIKKAQAWLENEGWNSKKDLIAVHPGMGGSALNWPVLHYINLIRKLVEEDRQVLITGGVAEKKLIGLIKAALGSLADRVMFFVCPPEETVALLGGLLQHASLVVAPSTGPLHLAVALRKPVLTFYPPVLVQSARRWGPYRDSGARILSPNVECPERFQCQGNTCEYYRCMESLSVESAWSQLRELENEKKKPKASVSHNHFYRLEQRPPEWPAG